MLASTDGGHILKRAEVPPDGTQSLALGLTDPNESVHIQIPGSEHGVSLLQFDYASFSKQTDAVISVCSKGSSDSEWVEAFRQSVSGADPNWTTKPWPTLTALVIALGDVDIRIKTGCRQVLIDNVLIRDLICPNVAPVFNHDSVVKPAAIEDRSYAASLSADVFDPNEGDTLTFSLLSASPWVTLDPNGVIASTPDDAHVGANLLTVRVQDDLGGFDEAVLEIEVLDLYNGKNGFDDFAAFSQSWLLTNCGYCGGGDLNESNNVDFLDFALFSQNWLN